MADGYQSKPSGIDAVVAQFVSIQKQLDDARRSLAGLGLHIDGPTGNLIIDANAMKTANFNGTLSPPAAGTTGVAIVNDTIIVNDIVLAGQIIGNDALTSPVSVAAGSASNDTFALTTTATTQATVTLAIPAGFTQALIFGVANVTGFNSTGSYDSVDVGIWIQGSSVGGLMAIEGTTPGGTVGATRGGSRLLTGLAGGNVTVQSRVRTGSAGWASSGANSTNLDAIAVFLR